MKTNLTEIREKKGFTRQKLACKLSVSPQYYGKVEKLNSVSIKKLKEICLALDYTHKETAKIILKELNLDVDLSCA